MNKDLPLISVALATYNGEKFLREQLDSIYAQSYKNIEVVACDDCSSDSTVIILEEYRQKYSLKYYINEKNLGFVKNFEKAISLCNGDFIALCDQDDVWKSNKIEYLLDRIGDSDLIFADAELIDENGTHLASSFMRYNSFQFVKINQFARLLYGNFIQGASMLFKSELKTKILPFPEGIYLHDWWIALAASENNNIKFDNVSLIHYRVHSNNTFGVSDRSDIKNRLKYFLENEDQINIRRKQSLFLIRSLKDRFKNNELHNEIIKAEKYYSTVINSNRSLTFKIYKFLFLTKLAIMNKYIFKPDLSYPAYIYKSFEYFILSNSLTRRILRLINRIK